MISVFLGRTFLRNSTVLAIARVAVAGSVQFYLITNFFVWFGCTGFNVPTYDGRSGCVLRCRPAVLWAHVVGDLVLFGCPLRYVYALLSRRLESERSVVAA